MYYLFKKYSPTKLIAVSSFIAISLITSLAGFVYMDVNKTIDKQTAYSTKINTSGYQRMLSQRIAYYTAEYLRYGEEDKEIAEGSMLLFHDRHIQLANEYSQSKRDTPLTALSDELNYLYFESPDNLNSAVNTYLETVTTLLNKTAVEGTINIASLKTQSQAILIKLDNIVKQYEIESKSEIASSNKLHAAVLFTIAILAVIQIFVVIVPLLSIAEKIATKLAQEANNDPLTGLYNRRLLKSFSKTALAESKRYQKPLSLVLFDIDNLKVVNDTYGHAFGDEVIKTVANTIKRFSRESDLAFRLGGEEFLLLLPKTELQGAHLLAEKIREKIASKSKENTIQNSTFSVSGGVTNVLYCEENIDDAIERADQALYKAKLKNKNKIILATTKNPS